MAITARTSNQARASTPIAIGFVVVALAGYFGYQFLNKRAVANMRFGPLEPGRVNVVGVDTSKGYRIIVANGLAQLVEGGSTGEGEAEPVFEEEAAGATKKRIPIKEMLQSMEGNGEAIGRFVMVLNDIQEDRLPPVRVYWSKSDIEQALAGDKALVSKLENDLNVRLDGTPLPTLRPSVLDKGIVLKVPITLQVPLEYRQKDVTGDILIPYESRFTQGVFVRISEKSQVTKEMITGYYFEEAQKLADDPKLRENVAESLKRLVSDSNLKQMGSLPQKVLNSVRVIVNDGQIKSADYEPVETSDKKLYNMQIRVTEEGRKRLWQYSQNNLGRQLLLIVDGVAIAAPRIKTELSRSDLTVSQLPDEVLVREATELINSLGEPKRA